MKRDKYYKDLRITHRFLTESGVDVPRELLLTLSQMIRDEEQRRRQSMLRRASEEQLIRMSSKQMHILRVTMADGMLIRGETNAQTFLDTLREIGYERLRQYDFRCGKHSLLVYDPTYARRRIAGYQYVCPGYFVRKLKGSSVMRTILSTIDSTLQLSMEIEMQ